VILAGVVVLAAWFTARVEITEWFVRRALFDTPFADATYTVTEVRTDRLVISNLDVEGLGAIGRIEIDYRLRQLLDGRVEVISVSDGHLVLHLDDRGRPTGPLEAFSGNDASASSPPSALPFGTLTVENLLVDVRAPWGYAAITLNGAAQARLAALSGAGQWQVDSTFGTARGTLDVATALVDDNTRVRLSVADGVLGHLNARADGVTGTVAFETVVDRDTALVNADLNAERISVQQHDIGVLAATLSWNGEVIEADLKLGQEDAPLSAELQLQSTPGESGHWLHAEGSITIDEDMPLPLAPGIHVTAPSSGSLFIDGRLPDVRSLTALPLDDQVGGPALPELIGEMVIATRGLDFGPKGRVGTVRGALAFESSALGVNIVSRPGFLFQGIDIAWDDQAEGALATFAGRPFDATVPPDGLRLSLVPDADGITLDTDLTLSAKRTEEFDTQLFVRGALALDHGLHVATIDLDTFELSASGRLLPDHAEGTVRLAGDVEGTPEELSGTMEFQADFERLGYDGIEAEQVSFDLPLTFERTGNEATARVNPLGILEAESIALGEATLTGVLAELPLTFGWAESSFMMGLSEAAWLDIGTFVHPMAASRGPTSLKLAEEHLPIIVAEQFRDDISWDARLMIEASDTHFDLFGGTGDRLATVHGSLPVSGIRFGSLGATHLQGTIETSGGNLAFEGPDVRLKEMRVLVTYNTGLSPWPQISADIREVTDLQVPSRFSPMVADFVVAPVWPLGDDVRLSGNLHMDGRRYLANAEASYQVESDLFRALLRLPPVKFEPGGSQPADVSPLYGAMFSETSGSFELYGEIAVQSGETSSDLVLSLYDLSATSGEARLSGVNGAIRFLDVAPLTTEPNQQITIDRLDIGLPLTDVALGLGLPGDDRLQLDVAQAHFAGGDVALEPTLLNISPDGHDLMLNITSIDLASLLEEADIPGLAIDAKMTGSIPIAITEQDIVISGGRLVADKPGTLVYTPSGSGLPLDLDDESMNLVLDVLSDFHFSNLALDVDREAGGSTELGVQLAGANPGLYDGYPIEFNVNLTGDLDKIVPDSLAGWRIPEEIRERLSGF